MKPTYLICDACGAKAIRSLSYPGGNGSTRTVDLCGSCAMDVLQGLITDTYETVTEKAEPYFVEKFFFEVRSRLKLDLERWGDWKICGGLPRKVCTCGALP